MREAVTGSLLVAILLTAALAWFQRQEIATLRAQRDRALAACQADE